MLGLKGKSLGEIYKNDVMLACYIEKRVVRIELAGGQSLTDREERNLSPFFFVSIFFTQCQSHWVQKGKYQEVSLLMEVSIFRL